mmetsp:Transcript_9252/g.13989  ORF Transcript_9252/g.13989 Transcript_9252/m.13989 type:complete len:600 (+) Transcript_9252:400-2199(+)
MVYKLRLRSSRSSCPHNSQPTVSPLPHLNQQPSCPDNSDVGPLRTISNTPPTRTPERKARKSASRIVMDIIDSPRRAIVNRKKRMSGEKNANEYSPVDLPACMMDVDHEEHDSYGMQVDIAATAAVSAHQEEPVFQTNVLAWLEDSAPRDIIPNILSYAGPKKMHALTRVNKSWNRICESEAVFRTLCEDLGKWTKGEDQDPDLQDPVFWKNVYLNNPIVPLDYSTIHKAAAAVCNTGFFLETEFPEFFQCTKNVRILVQPGLYVLDREIVVESMGGSSFTVKNHNMRTNATDVNDDSRPSTPSSASSRNSSESSSPAHTRRRLNSGIRNMLSCRQSAVEETDHELLVDVDQPREQVTIVLKTKRRNCPIFHIRQGRMKLSGLSLVHYCSGTDIWNGNSAVQIQPRMDEAYRATMPIAPNRPPTALLEGCAVMSVSGRGIVAIDGSSAFIRNSYIHQCAATGIYIGGAGSIARVFSTDVVNNGIGNKRSRRGIARGHSGVYLEQGAAFLSNCNVSHNALTGVSAVSQENCVLKIEDSDLIANGTQQLEMPPDGSTSWRKSSSVNNRIDRTGMMKLRSGLRLEEALINNAVEETADAVEE